MVSIEVSEYGTYLVVAGEVHDVYREPASFRTCWCTDDTHRPSARFQPPRPYKGQEPHLIGIRKFEQVWKVDQ